MLTNLEETTRCGDVMLMGMIESFFYWQKRNQHTSQHDISNFKNLYMRLKNRDTYKCAFVKYDKTPLKISANDISAATGIDKSRFIIHHQKISMTSSKISNPYEGIYFYSKNNTTDTGLITTTMSDTTQIITANIEYMTLLVTKDIDDITERRLIDAVNKLSNE